MQRALIEGGLILGLALVLLATAPAPAAAYGGSSFGGGFGVGGGHGGSGFHVGIRSGSRGFGSGYHGNRHTFGFGRGQYPGPQRLGRGWLDKGHGPPVATPLPSPGWGHSGRYGHIRRVNRRQTYQYLACGPYPCAPFGIGYFAPLQGPYGQRAYGPAGASRYRGQRYRGTGRYDRYRVE